MVEPIEIEVLVATAYNQWTRFEDFPHFMEGVESITQLDERDAEVEGHNRRRHTGV